MDEIYPKIHMKIDHCRMVLLGYKELQRHKFLSHNTTWYCFENLHIHPKMSQFFPNF
jgi:hypothetical protein